MESLSLHNVVARRGAFEVEVPALDLPAGSIGALMGPSGSGKSTVLETIAGFIPTLSGKICVGQQEVQRLFPEKRRMALVFQRAALFPHLTVEGNIAFGLHLQKLSKSACQRASREWIERVQLQGLENRFPYQLSEGQAQRVALARALAVKFPIVLLDEPFSALDTNTRVGLQQLLKSLVKDTGVTVLMVSHSQEEVQALAERVFIQEHGKVRGSVMPSRNPSLSNEIATGLRPSQ